RGTRSPSAQQDRRRLRAEADPDGARRRLSAGRVRMSLSRLRVRLTLWYAATFTLILLLLGAGLFLAIGTQVSRRIDASLAAATAAIVRATHDLENERSAGGAADAVEELHIPDRELYLFDISGHALTPPQADTWIADAALHGRCGARAPHAGDHSPNADGAGVGTATRSRA